MGTANANTWGKQVLAGVAVVLAALGTASCNADTDDMTVQGQPRVADGNWSFVVLPDTQKYAQHHPDVFAAQTRWIVDNADTENIEFAVHVGDIVNDHDADQWVVAQHSLRTLDSRVPYIIPPGNHDYAGNAKSRDTMLDEFFPAGDLSPDPALAGLFEAGRLDNVYKIFETPSGPWIALGLEFGPRDEVVQWANEVLDQHADLPAIISTHAYLYNDDTLYDRETRPDQKHSPYDYAIASLPGGVNDGQQLWDKLVSRHDNIVFVFSGHVLGDGLGRRTSIHDGGTLVHEVLANYQMRAIGGAGYLRLMEMSPRENTVNVRTYSPYLDLSKVELDNDFTLELSNTFAAAYDPGDAVQLQ